jgi:hypothetical protein
MTTLLSKPVRRKTRTTLGWGYGADTGRHLVVTIESSSKGDTLKLRPLGTRREEAVLIEDIYHWAIRSRCQKAHLEKARARKEALRARREAAEIRRRFRVTIK